ncbi:MAG: hypothetical protein WED05_05790 [Candidatus Atabeyarchaeum deiterrae]
MRVIGIVLEKLEAERNIGFEEQFPPVKSVGNNVRVKSVQNASLPTPSGNFEALRVGFAFQCIYDPNVASIRIEGQAICQVSKSEEDKMLSSWRSRADLPPDLMPLIVGPIIMKCLVKAAGLSDDLQVPPPIPPPPMPSPQTRKKDEKEGESYIA